jgi:hypothetical protein
MSLAYIDKNSIGGLCAFEDYAFDHVGDVFTLIDSGLDDFEDFLPLDDLHWVPFFVEQLRDQCPA